MSEVRTVQVFFFSSAKGVGLVCKGKSLDNGFVGWWVAACW